ncbi:hypothetical protein DIPPA_26130 [Diplonema papillatum]|nr:hypothetical protein DIPPA_26130 [Diplonema papillatum]
MTRQWTEVVQLEAAQAHERYKDMSPKEWHDACGGVVQSAAGKFVAAGEKVRRLREKISSFVGQGCIPEHGSWCGDDDEDGVDRGGSCRRGCLLPDTHRFDRASRKSVRATAGEEPAPYLEDLVRDWDLAAYLSASVEERSTLLQSLPSSKDYDWWAYAVMATYGFCPDTE